MFNQFLSKINDFLDDNSEDYSEKVFSKKRKNPENPEKSSDSEQNFYTNSTNSNKKSVSSPKNTQKSAPESPDSEQNIYTKTDFRENSSRHVPKILHNDIPFTPETTEDFIGVIRRTPLSVLSKTDRARIAAVMSYDSRIIADLMISKSKMVFVNQKDYLGPLTLDKLYKSGFTNFPVIDNQKNVVGILHTEALNALTIKKTDRAEKYMEKDISYLCAADPLSSLVSEFKNSGATFFLVQDSGGTLVGSITLSLLLDYLLE